MHSSDHALSLRELIRILLVFLRAAFEEDRFIMGTLIQFML